MTSVLRQRKQLNGSNFDPHTYQKKDFRGYSTDLRCYPLSFFIPIMRGTTDPCWSFFLLREMATYPLYISTLALGVTFFVPLRKMVK